MKNRHKTLAVIPARFASSRFPGKPLAMINGKSMIRRVYEQAGKARLIDGVIVATDDDRIFSHVRSFGGLVEMTSDRHRSGTDRCAEVAERAAGFGVVVNIQGDEPFIDPRQIDQVVEPVLTANGAGIATLAKRITDPEVLFDPNIVKVVFDQDQKALYFSRNTIPYLRDVDREHWLDQTSFYKHIGIYAFRREVLLEMAGLAAGRLEQCESLEQLRWLEAGEPIHLALTELETLGIDRPEDLKKFNF